MDAWVIAGVVAAMVVALVTVVRPSVGEELARIRTEFRCWDVADDDILDAMAAAITASADPVALKTLPEHPTMDSHDVPMEMVYWADPHRHTREWDE